MDNWRSFVSSRVYRISCAKWRTVCWRMCLLMVINVFSDEKKWRMQREWRKECEYRLSLPCTSNSKSFFLCDNQTKWALQTQTKHWLQRRTQDFICILAVYATDVILLNCFESQDNQIRDCVTSWSGKGHICVARCDLQDCSLQEGRRLVLLKYLSCQLVDISNASHSSSCLISKHHPYYILVLLINHHVMDNSFSGGCGK